MTMCASCQRGSHAHCHPVPDSEIEMRFTPCTCLHDHGKVQGDAKVADLIRQMAKAHRQDQPALVAQAARKVIALLDPPKGKLVDASARFTQPAPAKGTTDVA